ncbi:ligand-binding sensor domain-containing protein [Aureitalea marina]|uniref:Uncharacterized protein n=1 Tax=Aureitalea marina TaxID=930804 RepID=A0A2S7KSU5_9FLAO|nr:two-component regulator propeller domain-containing protein [Aureitalea marina]PQB05694.1 hypothetical protein BST85_12890 [Aureitalea marina]
MHLQKKRLIRWAVFIVGVLMIPLIAMQFTSEINWDVMDFVIMGAVLSVIGLAYELIAQRANRTVYRIAFGIGLLGAFLLFWVNGAVGIIGNEAQDANLLYATVFAVGLIGALVSRFRPKGMSVTLYTAAIVTLLVPTVAIFVWPPSAISWSPGVVEVFLISAFFAGVFGVSGMLFDQAARGKELTIWSNPYLNLGSLNTLFRRSFILLFNKTEAIAPRVLIILLVSSTLFSCNGQSKTVKDVEVTDTLVRRSHLPTTPFDKPGGMAMLQPYNLESMIREFIRTMYQDRSGIFWFGTNSDGVIRHDGDTLYKFTAADGYKGSSVRAIAEDDAGNIWFGTSGGLNKWDGEKFTNYSTEAGLDNEEIWSVMIDSKGRIWVGSVDGLSHFDGERFRPFEYPKPEVKNARPMLSSDRVGPIMEDLDGKIWITTDGQGITIWDGANFDFLTTANGLPDNSVSSLFIDSRGLLWIGTMFGGISSFDGQNFTNYMQNGTIEGPETGGLLEDKQGNIWFSAEHFGVYKYDGSEFTNYTAKDGLATNGVLSLMLDDKGSIWFGHWPGISGFDGERFFDISEKKPWEE